MSNELNFEGKSYISAQRAGELTGYASDDVGQLVREGKIKGHMIGRAWFVEQESLFAYAKVSPPTTYHPLVPMPRPSLLPKIATTFGVILVIISLGGVLVLTGPNISALARATMRPFAATIEKAISAVVTIPTQISPASSRAPHVRDTSSASASHATTVREKISHVLFTATDSALFSYVTFTKNTGNALARGMIGVGGTFIGSFIDTYRTLSHTGSSLGSALVTTYEQVGDGIADTTHKTGTLVRDTITHTGSGIASTLNRNSAQTANVLTSATDVLTNLWQGITGIFGTKTSSQHDTTPPPVADTTDTATTTPPTSSPTSSKPTPPPAPKTVIINKISKPLEKVTVERTVERVISGVTAEDLDSRMQALSNKLLAEIYKVADASASRTSGNFHAIALTQKIDQLTNTNINTPTITGANISSGTISGANISGGSISGTAISGSVSLESGTFSGNITVSGTGTSTFAGDANFDSNTLYVDATNNRVGIGTSSPADTLSVAGPIYLADSAPGSTGNRLYSSGGSLYWAGSLIGGASTGNWTTDGTHVWRATGNVGIGTTSPYAKLSVAGNAAIDGNVRASYFTATSTTASVFPYASTTALTVSGSNGLTLGSLSGPLQASAGAVSATTSIGVLYGGTGITTAPSYGQLLLGNASNGYTLTATSSLGISLSDTTGTLAVSRGGTGLSSWTQGDVLYASGPGTLAGTTTANLKTTLALDNVENTALSTWAGTTNITTLGTIGTGVWHGTAIGDAYLTKTGDWTGTLDGYEASALLGDGHAYPFPSNATTTQLSLNGGVNTSGTTGGYSIDNNLILQASSTNYGTFLGYQAGLANQATGLRNTFLGYQAGKTNTTGDDNLFSGYQAGFSNTTGSSNIFQGNAAGLFNSAGSNNIFQGSSAGFSNTTGSSNIFQGNGAGNSNTTGSYNIFQGNGAGALNTTGSGSIFQGYYAGAFNNGSANIGIGYRVGNGVFGATTYASSTIIGYQAGYALTSGSSNLLLGYQAGDNLTTGSNNIVLGYDIDAPAVDSANTLNIGNLLYGTGIDGTGTTLSSGNVGIGTTSPYAKLSVAGNAAIDGNVRASYFTATSTTAKSLFTGGVNTSGTTGGYSIDNNLILQASSTNYGTFLGYQAGQANQATGISNTFLGYQAGKANTTGDYNLFSGYQAGFSNTTGSSNIFQGNYAGYWNTTGSNNTFQGSSAGEWNNGSANIGIGYNAGQGTFGATYASSTIIGYQAGYALTTGSSNLLLGYQAGDNLTTGSNNIVLGYNIDAPSASSANTLNIGNLLYGTGIDGTGTTLSSGNVGIGTSTPYAKLSVAGETVAEYFTATSTSATTTIYGGLNVGSGALTYNSSSGVTSVGSLEFGAMNFETNAGVISWSDLPVTSAVSAGTKESYTAQVDGTSLLTVYAESDGAGGIQNYGVGVGTTTPFSKLSVTGTSGSTRPLFTVASSTEASFFSVLSSGNIGVGTTSPVSTLSVEGSLCVTVSGLCGTTGGTIYADNTTVQSADLAEKYQAFEDNLTPGTIVSVTQDILSATTTEFTDSFGVVKADSTHPNMIGVVSTKPGFTLGNATPRSVPVALQGRVPVKVNLQEGDIAVGDKITLSDTAGVGMRATTSAYTVGIALESFTASSQKDAQGIGSIMVLMNLGWSKLDPAITGDTLATLDGTESAFWAVDQSSGRIKFITALDLNDFDINNVSAIRGSAGKWSIDASGRFVAREVSAERLCLGDTCIDEAQLKALLGASGVSAAGGSGGSGSGTSSSGTTEPTTTPATITPTTTSGDSGSGAATTTATTTAETTSGTSAPATTTPDTTGDTTGNTTGGTDAATTTPAEPPTDTATATSTPNTTSGSDTTANSTPSATSTTPTPEPATPPVVTDPAPTPTPDTTVTTTATTTSSV